MKKMELKTLRKCIIAKWLLHGFGQKLECFSFVYFDILDRKKVFYSIKTSP